MKSLLIGFLLCGMAWATDTTVVVKTVNMEVGSAGAVSYNYHSMTVDVDGISYKIYRPFVKNETWLHKGTYIGRWKDAKKQRLEVDIPEEDGKLRHVAFKVLSEE